MIKKEHQKTWEVRGRPGIFAGYDMAPGMVWNKRYKVWDLDVFLNKTMRSNTPASVMGSCKAYSIRKIRRLFAHNGDTVFPLLERYLHDNETLEGREEAQRILHKKDEATMHDLFAATTDLPPAGEPETHGADVYVTSTGNGAEVTPPLGPGNRSVDADRVASGGDAVLKAALEESSGSGHRPARDEKATHNASFDPSTLTNNDKGQLCVPDARGRLYPCDEQGSRVQSNPNADRLKAGLSTFEWYNLKAADRKKAVNEARMATCAPMGWSGFNNSHQTEVKVLSEIVAAPAATPHEETQDDEHWGIPPWEAWNNDADTHLRHTTLNNGHPEEWINSTTYVAAACSAESLARTARQLQ